MTLFEHICKRMEHKLCIQAELILNKSFLPIPLENIALRISNSLSYLFRLIKYVIEIFTILGLTAS